MVLVLSTSSDGVLYLFVKVSHRASGSTLGWSQMLTDRHMNGRKTRSLYRAMHEAGATMRSSIVSYSTNISCLHHLMVFYTCTKFC